MHNIMIRIEYKEIIFNAANSYGLHQVLNLTANSHLPSNDFVFNKPGQEHQHTHLVSLADVLFM